MIGVWGLLSVRPALALDRAHVDQHRSRQGFRPTEQAGQFPHLVAVHGADVGKAHVLEEAAGQDRALDALLYFVVKVIQNPSAGDFFEHFPVRPLEGQVGGTQVVPGQQGGDAAYVLLDGHTVVIEDDHQVLPALPGVGQPLVGQAAGEGAVADEGDDLVILLLQRPRPSHAHGHGDRVGGVAGNEGVVFALLRLGEAGQAAHLAQGGHPVGAAGQYFMAVALVSHVEHQAIFGRVVHPVDGHGQLYCP